MSDPLLKGVPAAGERLGEAKGDPNRCRLMVDVGRRHFLKGAVVAAAVAVAPKGFGQASNRAAANTTAMSPARAGSDYPANRLANLKDLKLDTPVAVAYPDAASPGVLLKLGQRVEGGAGPEGDVVAFSTICPHKGYPMSYHAASRTLNCPGHYSVFDVERGGLEVFGHAAQNLAQFKLRVDPATGDIFAEGVDELIYGRTGNVLG